MTKNKLVGFAVIACVCTMLLITSVQPTSAKFVISSWEYPDEYGQGIGVIYVHENSTGAWLPFTSPAFILSTDSGVVTVNASANKAIRLGPVFSINHTLLGLGSIAEAKNIMRGNITVTNLGAVVFSQENFTYNTYGDETATTWWVAYYVTINLIIVAGAIYTVTVTYEIFW